MLITHLIRRALIANNLRFLEAAGTKNYDLIIEINEYEK